MAKNDNPNAVRLYESLVRHEETESAEIIAQTYPLSKSATAEKKFEWAKSICEYLNENYDAKKVSEIRMDCACGPELGKGKKLKDLYEKETDPVAFVQKANNLNQGFTLAFDGKSYFLTYPQCYCSCVKRVNQTLPKAWCDCALGYTKKMFSYIFSCNVQVELLSSVKMGDDDCRIKITQS